MSLDGPGPLLGGALRQTLLQGDQAMLRLNVFRRWRHEVGEAHPKLLECTTCGEKRFPLLMLLHQGDILRVRVPHFVETEVFANLGIPEVSSRGGGNPRHMMRRPELPRFAHHVM